MYPDTKLLIAGVAVDGAGGVQQPVLNPATNQQIGQFAVAEESDLETAAKSAHAGFEIWKKKTCYERSNILLKAAQILRERADDIAPVMTMEQGKPIAESRVEVLFAADLIDWFAQEARRIYGRLVPARMPGVTQSVIKEPVGPVAAFTPWNFPIVQAVRKISAALAAGCSIVVKGPEETPASCAALIQAYLDAGVTPEALHLVFGRPAEISSYLIAHPAIRKVSFTGSTPVGKQLAALAGQHMKRITMELGGHAPVLVFDDADVDSAVKVLVASKFRNAGQVCVSPTRFMVQDGVKEQFTEKLLSRVAGLKVGSGDDPDSDMAALANQRRVDAMENLIQDAVTHGATLETGGTRLANQGNFFTPTVLSDVPVQARIMNEEPFGPVILLNGFSDYDAAVAEANRLPYGLAAYAFTKSATTARRLGEDIETGMLSINHYGLGPAELPFGGIKDSGFGSEGGSEAIESYLNTKLVTTLS